MPDDDQMELTITDVKKLWDKLFGVEYTVESFDHYRKQKGVKYKVAHRGDNSWSCPCESFLYKSGTEDIEDDSGKVHKDTCKHIRFCMEKEGIKYTRKYRRV